MATGITTSGSFDKTEAFLKKMSSGGIFDQLSRYGEAGRAALAGATPLDSGETANSWTYEIVQDAKSWSIIWGNTHIEDGRPIAVLLQFGHGTRTGGFVEGRDYINPALQGIFDQIATEAWKVVTTA
jgi:hypothetical protein